MKSKLNIERGTVREENTERERERDEREEIMNENEKVVQSCNSTGV